MNLATKYTILVISWYLGLFASVWLFNHLSAYIGIAMALVTTYTGIYYLLRLIKNKK